MIRLYHPRTILEIGSGESTGTAACALQVNQHEDKKVGTHICIEPFRQNEIRSDPKPDVIPKLSGMSQPHGMQRAEFGFKK